MNLSQQTWPRRQALGVSAVLNSAAGTWKGRYGLRLEAEDEDQRARHPFADILRLKLVKELVDLDVSARRACTIANDCFDTLGAIDPDALDQVHRDGPYIVVRHIGLPRRTVAELVETLGAVIDTLRMPGTSGCAVVVDLTMLARKVARLIKTMVLPEEAFQDPSMTVEERAQEIWNLSPRAKEEFGEFEVLLHYLKGRESGAISSD